MLFAGLLIFSSCNREDEEVHATYADANWFVIPDKPGDFNQLAYDIFQETGIPIFVNDTLGEEYYAVDAQGNPIFRTESFNIWYSLFGMMDRPDTHKGDCYIVQSADSAAMIKAATVLRERVIPLLPPSGEFRPKCYFLVDSINDNYAATIGFSTAKFRMENLTCYSALKGIVVGQLCDIETMTDEELDLWAGKILAVKIAPWIIATYEIDERLSEFYEITNSEATNAKKTFYGQTYASYTTNYENDMFVKAGMFGWFVEGAYLSGSVTDNARVTYTQESDIAEYVARVYAYRGKESKFKTEYEAYDKVIKKFDIIRQFVAEYEERYHVSVR